MEIDEVRDYFSSDMVVDHYAHASTHVGLWQSEESILQKFFKKNFSLLDIGTGCGRIAMGLNELGYGNVMGVDFSRPMIREARRIAKLLQYPIPFRVADATRLDLIFGKSVFEGAIFGFNGLMQIPKWENRRRALKAVFKILVPGGYFIFTTHDRALSKHKKFWNREKSLWHRGKQKEQLDEFGDRYENTPMGNLYIHVPLCNEIRQELKAVGFKVISDVLRSMLANETHEVRDFSDQCRFWVAQKPATPDNAIDIEDISNDIF